MVAAKCKVSFRNPKRERKAAEAEPLAAPPVSRTAKLLALAYEVDDAIRRGEIKDMAEAARLAGVTRARMTQVINLMLLPSELQETILLGARDIAERELRRSYLNVCTTAGSHTAETATASSEVS